MGTPSLTRAGLTAMFSLALTAYAWAAKTVDMPADFGQSDWALSHYQEAVGYLKYMTDNETRKKLLGVPENMRMEAWEEFWKGRDPDKTTPANELRDTYFDRLRYVNEEFGTILQPGWLTDRGEVYIRMGQPNSKEKFTMRAGGRDIEVWNYLLHRDIYLIFLDQTGVGDFYLLNTSAMLDEVYLR